MTSEAAVAVRPLQSGGAEDSAKRRQILDGARAVFLSQGFYAASMGEIARAAGVSKGTLYVYFDSKEELFQAIVHQQCQVHAEGLFDLSAEGEDVETALTRLGVGFVSFLFIHNGSGAFAGRSGRDDTPARNPNLLHSDDRRDGDDLNH